MKLILENFMCYDELVEFNFSNITLIKGVCGRGKTTIFDAIMWCLYDYPPGVSPDTKKKCETTVILDLPSFVKITRKTNPRRLEIFYKNTYYSDQKVINHLFGSLDLWLASCYQQQEELNLLLTCSSKRRFELFQELIGDTENKKKIEQIENDINVLIEKYKICKGVHDKLLEDYEEVEEDFDQNEKEKIIEDIKIFEKTLFKKENELKSILVKNERINVLTGQLKEITYSKPDEIFKDVDTGVFKELLNYSTIEAREVSNIEKLKEDYNLRKRYLAICDSLKISYDSFLQEIEKCERLVSLHQEKIKYLKFVQNKKKLLQNELQEVPEMMESKHNLNELLIKSQPCPNCGVKLHVQKSIFQVDKYQNDEEKQKHILYEKKVSENNTRRENIIKSNSVKEKVLSKIHLDEDVECVDFELLSAKELSFLNQKLKKLREIKCFIADNDYVSLSRQHRKFQLLRKIPSEMHKFEPIFVLEQKKKYRNWIKIENSNKEIRKKLELLGSKIDQTIIEDEIKNLQKNKKQKERRLDILRKLEISSLKKKKLQKSVDDLEKQYETIMDLTSFRDICDEIIYSRTDDLKKYFIHKVSKLCNEMFDETIEIEIKNFKKFIVYKNGRVSKKLSRGQKKRVSLAIMLVLAEYNSCPFIILDESFSALDAKSRVDVVNVLKHNTNKTCLITLHECREGMFEETLDLDQ